MEDSSEEQTPKIDWFIFTVGTVLLLMVVVPIVVAPAWSEQVINDVMAYITGTYGIWYVNLACVVFVFLVWLAISEKGRIVLGPEGVQPSYSRFSWVAMLFCTGIGAALIYWGAAEWTFYYQAPPFSVEPRSDQAIYWATSYGLFHWGPFAWALYCLPTIAFCISYHYKGVPWARTR